MFGNLIVVFIIKYILYIYKYCIKFKKSLNIDSNFGFIFFCLSWKGVGIKFNIKWIFFVKYWYWVI